MRPAARTLVRAARSLVIGLLVVAAAASAHDGAGIGPAYLEAETAERALAGAEWLAARIDDDRAEETASAAPFALVETLIWRAKAERAEVQTAFGAALADLGYGDPSWAVALWIEEFTDLVAAHESGRAGAGRVLAEIDAELLLLPTVPLDAAGEAERDKLFDERALAAVPEESRAVAAPFAARIEAVLGLVRGKKP